MAAFLKTPLNYGELKKAEQFRQPICLNESEATGNRSLRFKACPPTNLSMRTLDPPPPTPTPASFLLRSPRVACPLHPLQPTPPHSRVTVGKRNYVELL
ncbi:hypothetical protein BaRGS_00028884 [Batillaria attramentaria]|uniref:Uncharacterized protein n=1 Tax=Batillaria attramentaria TaxID=370345 RepID=A0ABD0JYW6_9CAEN